MLVHRIDKSKDLRYHQIGFRGNLLIKIELSQYLDERGVFLNRNAMMSG